MARKLPPLTEVVCTDCGGPAFFYYVHKSKPNRCPDCLVELNRKRMREAYQPVDHPWAKQKSQRIEKPIPAPNQPNPTKRYFNECTRCHEPKNSTQCPYCYGCRKLKKRKAVFRAVSTGRIDLIRAFVDRIRIDQAGFLSLQDMSDIITYYEMVAIDNLAMGAATQRKIMWEELVKFYDLHHEILPKNQDSSENDI